MIWASIVCLVLFAVIGMFTALGYLLEWLGKSSETRSRWPEDYEYPGVHTHIIEKYQKEAEENSLKQKTKTGYIPKPDSAFSYDVAAKIAMIATELGNYEYSNALVGYSYVLRSPSLELSYRRNNGSALGTGKEAVIKASYYFEDKKGWFPVYDKRYNQAATEPEVCRKGVWADLLDPLYEEARVKREKRLEEEALQELSDLHNRYGDID